MAIRRVLRSLLTGASVALAMSAAGCTIYPSTPSDPAFDTDVLPIFEAHCTRCHGAGPDGGALNTASIPGMGLMEASGPCLTQFGDNSTLDPNGNGCLAGANTYATKIQAYIDPNFMSRMPPPPAPVLDSWEMAVVNAWVAEKPKRTCSNSSQPAPALLCNGKDGGS
jgi:hypothetical protein